jgi:hypothetical protein
VSMRAQYGQIANLREDLSRDPTDLRGSGEEPVWMEQRHPVTLTYSKQTYLTT